MSIRKLAGLAVAWRYILTGARSRAARRYDVPGTVLSFFAHDPSAAVLEPVLRWLKQHGFAFVSTDALLEMVEGKRSWRPKMAWLTFDDGWAGFEQNLLPVLERYGAAATIFVAPHETARGQIWTNSVMRDVPGETWMGWYALPSEERYRQVDEVLRAVGNPRRLADETELHRLARHPLVTLENHTYTHLSASHRPVEEVVAEVRRTQEILSSWTGRMPRLCCYPFGHWTKETDRAIVSEGVIPIHSEPGVMTLATVGQVRNMCTDTMSASENIGRILGAWPTVKVWRG